MSATGSYSAELIVAGRFAAAGWNVYFPHRDKGFDFVISKAIGAGGSQVLRPVQVKGLYPTAAKKNKATYGYVGRLTELHDAMVLAIPYFTATNLERPLCIAFMPRSQIKRHSRGFRCQPATFKAGVPAPRREFARFFDEAGLALLERPTIE